MSKTRNFSNNLIDLFLVNMFVTIIRLLDYFDNRKIIFESFDYSIWLFP
jgi:hypothetical protein